MSSSRLASLFGVETFAISHREKGSKVVTFDAQKVKVAVGCIAAMPERGEYIHMIVGQEFAGFDLIPAFLELTKAKCFSRLYLTTLGFSRDNLEQMRAMIHAGQVKPSATTILCGDFFRRADVGLWEIGRALAKEHGFGFRSMRNHTKIILAELSGKFYIVESSANLRSCHNIEAFTITQSKPLFDFHAKWIDQAFSVATP